MCFPRVLFCELLMEMSSLTSTCKCIFQNAGDRLAKANCYSSSLHINLFNRPCISKNVVLLINFLICFKIQLDTHVKCTYNAENLMSVVWSCIPDFISLRRFVAAFLTCNLLIYFR